MKHYKLPKLNDRREVVILADGLFPTHEIALSILANCDFLVCCDGAVNNLTEREFRCPDAIVGDCDSLSPQNIERYRSIIHQIADQDTNDLTKAVNFCVEKGLRNITILGATGKREDHTIANVSLLCEYMQVANVEMVSDYGVFVGIDTTSSFQSFSNQAVSVFCIDSKPISSRNLKYPIDNHSFNSWWQATLNVADGDNFEIECSGKMLVYRVI